jgi:hypothetical protein
MKSHPANPRMLAEVLAGDQLETMGDWLADIKLHPEMYYSDHLMICATNRVLPLSERAWRIACRSMA